MSNHPVRNGSLTGFLDRDHRYSLLAIILAVSLFLLFGNANQREIVTPEGSPDQAAYSPAQAPASLLSVPQTRFSLSAKPAGADTDSSLSSSSPQPQLSLPADNTEANTGSSLSSSSPQPPFSIPPGNAGESTGDHLASSSPQPRLHIPADNISTRNPVMPAVVKTPTNKHRQTAQEPKQRVVIQSSTELSRKAVVAPITTQTVAIQQPPSTRASARDIDPQWQRYRIRKGDSLSRIFKRLRLPNVLALKLSRKRPGSLLQRLRPGRTLFWKTATDRTLVALSYAFSTENTLEIRLSETGYQAIISAKPVEIIQRQSSGIIVSSLGQATRQQGVPTSVMLQLVEIFGWDIDFGQDLRPNDGFKVLWQQGRWQGKVVRNGPILAAEFVNRGVRYQAVRFTDSGGKTGYYAPDGSSLRRSFLRTPVKFSRISSGFSLRRYHPKLKKWRAHKGVDYAAARGTSVRSTADGTVLFKGWKGGYGRTVIIRHGGPYSTLYAHLSKFSRGLRDGSRVKQGDIVAYVGSSGLATGPHLHYEFRVNGKYKNPVTFRPPRALAVPKRDLLAFRSSTRQYLAKLEAEQRIRVVASR